MDNIIIDSPRTGAVQPGSSRHTRPANATPGMYDFPQNQQLGPWNLWLAVCYGSTRIVEVFDLPSTATPGVARQRAVDCISFGRMQSEVEVGSLSGAQRGCSRRGFLFWEG